MVGFGKKDLPEFLMRNRLIVQLTSHVEAKRTKEPEDLYKSPSIQIKQYKII